MIYHHPFPIPEKGISGSKVRIPRMAEAFANIGFQVNLVSGFAKERKKAIERIKTDIRNGEKIEFLYSESSTAPSLISKKNLLHPFVDINFFRYCKNHLIPTGLYYRDVYWVHGHNKYSPWIKGFLARKLYQYDWLCYEHSVDHLFLQTSSMKTALPGDWPDTHVSELPPGCNIFRTHDRDKSNKNNHCLNLFYVGGITPPLYDLLPLFQSILNVNEVHLTVCCRDFEWKEVHHYYEPFDRNKIDIVHVSGKGLIQYYQSSDIFTIVRKPDPYLNFVLPVKVFEALGHGAPILTTPGTETAKFIVREKVGWVIDLDQLSDFLSSIQTNPQDIIAKRKHIEEIRKNHTWETRAHSVVETLSR